MEFLVGALAIVGAVVGLFLFFMIGTYNRLVVLRQNVRESWSAIDTELRRRYDLIPNLVEVVKGYATHERQTLEDVVKARNAAVDLVSSHASPESLAASEKALSGALRQVFALSEAYPQLQANENFQSLQKELSETETRISQARRFYNANVREMNTAVESFPTVLVAGTFGFRGQLYFGIDDAAALEPVRITGMLTDQPSEKAGETIKIPETKKEL